MTLYLACKNKDINKINEYLKGSCDWNDGLKGAYDGKHYDIMVLMIDKGATISEKIFADACENNYIDFVKLMIKYVTYTMVINNFMYACRIGHLSIIKLLIQYGANDWKSGLRIACQEQNLELINLMIDHDANNFNEGLYEACREGHLDIINLMIEYGADDWNYGLCGACEGGHLNFVKLMINLGADDWNSGLSSACEGGHLDLIYLMISYGADEFSCCFDYAYENKCLKLLYLVVDKMECDTWEWNRFKKSNNLILYRVYCSHNNDYNTEKLNKLIVESPIYNILKYSKFGRLKKIPHELFHTLFLNEYT